MGIFSKPKKSTQSMLIGLFAYSVGISIAILGINIMHNPVHFYVVEGCAIAEMILGIYCFLKMDKERKKEKLKSDVEKE